MAGEVGERIPSSDGSSHACSVDSPSSNRLRVIVLHNGPAPLHHDARYNPFHFLGRWLSGAAVYGCWVTDDDELALLRERVRPAAGGFEYLPVPTTHIRPGWLRPFLAPWRLYREALRYGKAHRGDLAAIVVYSPYWVGFAAFLVARRLRVPLLVQVPTDMRAAFHAQPGRLLALKRRVAARVAQVVMGSAAGWNLYFEGQTGGLDPSAGTIVSYFPDFSPLSAVPHGRDEEREFLVVGFPWTVKGVDIAIRAFLQAGDALSGWRLRIVGHCEDRTPFETLAGGDPRIVMQGPVAHTTALDLIASCGVYVLASRTEGIARVAMEAMAAGRPVISTRVGGMPMVIRDGETGLLVDPEDVDALSKAMVTVAGDATMRARLGGAARAHVLQEYSEEAWAARLAGMVDQVATQRPVGAAS